MEVVHIGAPPLPRGPDHGADGVKQGRGHLEEPVEEGLAELLPPALGVEEVEEHDTSDEERDKVEDELAKRVAPEVVPLAVVDLLLLLLLVQPAAAAQARATGLRGLLPSRPARHLLLRLLLRGGRWIGWGWCLAAPTGRPARARQRGRQGQAGWRRQELWGEQWGCALWDGAAGGGGWRSAPRLRPRLDLAHGGRGPWRPARDLLSAVLVAGAPLGPRAPLGGCEWPDSAGLPGRVRHRHASALWHPPRIAGPRCRRSHELCEPGAGPPDRVGPSRAAPGRGGLRVRFVCG
mmetsp:Transcript_24340/g.66061  ORF Transcript_24340/g.66061 Transcript_24340/m.66061 type:complete len:292 (+) Transcript_24340:693-1568(+)